MITGFPPDYLCLLIRETEKKILATAEYYGLPEEEIEDRIWRKLGLVESATTAEEAAELAKKAWDSLFVHVLVLWGKKKIRGPATEENFEKKAKQADGLADFQERKGNDEAAKKQRQRAAGLRKEAEALRKKT